MCFQDDVIMGTLTVRENLQFSANLRLNPRNYSPADKKSRVNATIEDLGLTDCADTKVVCHAIQTNRCIITHSNLTKIQVWLLY